MLNDTSPDIKNVVEASIQKKKPSKDLAEKVHLRIELCEAIRDSKTQPEMADYQYGISSCPDIQQFHVDGYKKLDIGAYSSTTKLEIIQHLHKNNLQVFNKLLQIHNGKNLTNKRRTTSIQGKDNYVDSSRLSTILDETKDKNKAKVTLKYLDLAISADKKICCTQGLTKTLNYYKDFPKLVEKLLDENILPNEVHVPLISNFLEGKGVENPKKLNSQQTQLIYHILRNHSEGELLKTDNYEAISNMDNEQLDITRNVFDTFKDIKTVSISTIIQAPKVLKTFQNHLDLIESLGNDLKDILLDEEFTPEAITASIENTPKIPPKVAKKFPDAYGKVYLLQVMSEVGIIPKEKNVPEKAKNLYQRLYNVSPQIAKEFLELTFDESDIFMNLDNQQATDFALKYIGENKSSKDFIIKLFKTDNIKEQWQTLENLREKSNEIVKALRLKCKDLSPNFTDWFQDFIESEDFDNTFYQSNLSMNNLIDNFYSTAKILSYVNAKPQDYINGEHSQEVIECVKKMRNHKDTPNNAIDMHDRVHNEAKNINDKIIWAIEQNYSKIADAISATDLETVKLLLDKRLKVFAEKITMISLLPIQDKNILSDLIRNGKRINKQGVPAKLSGQQKLDLINLVKHSEEIARTTGIPCDYSKYKTPIGDGKFILDIDSLHKDIFNKILLGNGFKQSEIDNLNPKNLNWDMNYVSLLSTKPSRDNGELMTVVRESSKGNFHNFIHDLSNPHGRANKKTEEEFRKHNLNYDNWINGFKEKKFVIDGQEYTIKTWNRIPQESIFDGSYTTCCTAIDGCSGGSMANYLMNTAFNVIEVKDKNGKTFGMSRCYIAEINGKNTFVMENIEANNKFVKQYAFTENMNEFANNIFDYIKEYAETIGGKDMPVYMSTRYHHITSQPFLDYKKTDARLNFIGEISKPQIYINTFGGYVPTNPVPNRPVTFHVIKE